MENNYKLAVVTIEGQTYLCDVVIRQISETTGDYVLLLAGDKEEKEISVDSIEEVRFVLNASSLFDLSGKEIITL